ncbi:MAG: DUF6629 family protein [Bacteroidota bacterium]
MCFSAGASFAGGAVLTVIGAASVRSARNKSQKLFASIPLLFAFQQFSEGVVWLTLRSGGNHNMQMTAAYIFLVMALVVWPSVMPLAARRLEQDKNRKRIITWMMASGLLLSGYYGFCLIAYNVTPVISEFHIKYVNDFPKPLSDSAFVIYAIATLGPLFASGVKRMYLFGILVTLSCLVTGIFYREYLTSVWCFFAALISVVIYWIVKEAQEETVPYYIRVRKAFSDFIKNI